MNKTLFLPAVLFSLVFFFSCSSGDKKKTHDDYCAKTPITKECLAGEWRLDRGEGNNNNANVNMRGRLIFKADGRYELLDLSYGSYSGLERLGKWSLSGSDISVTCEDGNCNQSYQTTKGTITVTNGTSLKIKSTTPGSNSSCKVGVFTTYCESLSASENFAEIYTWVGE